MVNYENGKIYKLTSKNPECDLIYIGSTCSELRKRKSNHKAKYNQWLKNKKYKDNHIVNYSSFRIIENGDFNIELIENYSCKNKNELLKRENYFINKFDCVNKRTESKNKIEYRKNYHKQEYVKEKKKKHYEDNKEHYKNYKKEYYEKRKKEWTKKINCACGGHYIAMSKNRHEKTLKHKNFLES